ncbi:MAG: MtrB/PioB family outer membrane beta-barrel protein [Vicinamibacterales bacterium]
MRHTLTTAAAFLLLTAVAASAQEPPTLPARTDPVELGRSEMSGKLYGTLDFGARLNETDGDQARFQRYRDLRPGIYGTNALVGRRTEEWNLEAQAWNAGYRDQRYQLDFQRVGRLTVSFLWDQIPMFISRDTRMLYTESSAGVFRLEDGLQQEIQGGTKTLRNFEDQAVRFDLRTLRKIGQADIVFNVDRSTDVLIKVRNTTREGAIPFGGTFGFNNAVELPVPVDTRTTDVQTALEWANTKGLLRVGWDGSSFHNSVESVTWDNPLRFGPDIAATPAQGRMALWPSNTLNYLHGTGSLSLPARGRLTGYLALGQGRSNADLLPFTINTAIAPIALARPTADATHQMTIAQLTYAARPLRRVSFNAKYRYSDVDVQTPIFDRPGGTVAYDSSFQAAAGSSQYHSVKRSTFDADGAFQVVPSTSIKVGFSHLGTDYTSRIWESTAENVFRLSVDTTGNQYVMLRGVYENRQREGDGFEAEALAEVGELAGLRHYDIADRDRQRLTLIANVTPGGIFGLTASAGIGRDEYPNSAHGLQSFDSDQYSAGFNVVPDDHYSLTASYGWERYRSLQRSRNANSAADQANPLRDWTTDFTGKVNFLEAALDVAEAIERTTLRLSLDWNRSNDTYLYGLVAGSPLAVPEQLPPVKNELLRSEVDLSYEVSRNLRLGVAYWFDDYNVQDFALGPTTLTGIAFPPVQEGVPVAATNALLLGYLYRPYTAHAGFVRLTYAW